METFLTSEFLVKCYFEERSPCHFSNQLEFSIKISLFLLLKSMYGFFLPSCTSYSLLETKTPSHSLLCPILSWVLVDSIYLRHFTIMYFCHCEFSERITKKSYGGLRRIWKFPHIFTNNGHFRLWGHIYFVERYYNARKIRIQIYC